MKSKIHKLKKAMAKAVCKKTKLVFALCLAGFMANAQTVTSLIVGGGGSGGGSPSGYGGSGGGGGGGVKLVNSTLTSGVTYYITAIGSGGAALGSGSSANGNNGTSSTFNGITVGGGGGGGNDYYQPGDNTDGSPGSSPGGSGGGAGQNPNYSSSGGVGSSPGGYAGGTLTTFVTAGAGGGGAGAVGTQGSAGATGGSGGAGFYWSVTGNTYGGGGGGAAQSYVGTGGAGGGGAGGIQGTSNGVSGTANTGGGGGGVYGTAGNVPGAGGSGVVILYFTNSSIPNYTQTGGTVSNPTSGTTLITYNTTGTFIINTPVPSTIPWVYGGNSGTYNSTANDWYSIGSLDASSELPFVAGGSSGGVERMRIKSNGQVGIGTASPTSGYLLHVNGDVLVAGGAHSSAGFWQSSDSRYKKDVKKLESVNDKIKKLNGYTYNYNTDEFKDKNFSKEQQIGLIAQELKEVFPQLVKADDKGYLAVNYGGMVPILLEAIKNQQEKIDKQDSINTALQNQLNQLANAINACCANNNAASKIGAVSTINTIDLASNAAIIYQNAPNPFGDGTMIKYFIPENTTNAQVIFYDELGNQLKNFAVSETGAGQLNINSANLALGTYSYSLIINGKVVDTKKMIKTN